MPRVLFFVSHESGNTAKEPAIPLAGAHAWRALGGHGMRKWFPLDVINPEGDVLDFRRQDADVATLRDARLMIYATFLWAPAHWSDGKPAYRSYDRGCTRIKRGRSGESTDDIEFNAALEYCVNPPPLSADRARWMGEKIGYRYGEVIAFPSCWNEVGYPDAYFPPGVRLMREFGEEGKRRAVRMVHEQFTIPFIEGYRKHCPNARFVGPEANEWGSLHHHLEHERELGARLYDVVTWHHYAHDDPPFTESLAVVRDQLMQKVRLFGGGRPVWCSETGAPDVAAWCRALLAEFPEIGLINIHSPESALFEPGTYFSDAPRPNAQGRALQALIREVNAKRRAVRA